MRMLRRGAPARRDRAADWPVIIISGLLLLLVLTGLALVAGGYSQAPENRHMISEGGGYIFLGLFVWCIGAAGYALAMKRRRIPYERQIDAVHDSLVNVQDLLAGVIPPADEPPTGPLAEVREFRPRRLCAIPGSGDSGGLPVMATMSGYDRTAGHRTS